jgi:hypothetical protein
MPGRSDILMRRLSIITLLLVPAFCAATTLDSYVSAVYEGDSLGFSAGRHRIELDALVTGRSWDASLDGSFTGSDSSAVIPRYLLRSIDTDLDFSYRPGAFVINPDFRYSFHPGDSTQIIFPASAGTGVRNGFMRPGLLLGADIPGDITLSGVVHYWDRDVEDENGEAVSWTELRYGGGLAWRSPWGFDLSASGVFHDTKIEDLDYDTDWSRLDFAVSTEPRNIPTLTHVTAEVRYSVLDGDDYLGSPIASRLTGRIRAVKEFNPFLSLNMTVTSAIDFDDGTTRLASNQGAARLVYNWGRRPGLVPSSISIGGQVTGSVIETRRVDLASRINLYGGLSLLVNAGVWEGPTSVAGAAPTRKKILYGGGFEYRILQSLLVWATVSQERSDLAEIEVWERLDMGVEFNPGRLIF